MTHPPQQRPAGPGPYVTAGYNSGTIVCDMPELDRHGRALFGVVEDAVASINRIYTALNAMTQAKMGWAGPASVEMEKYLTAIDKATGAALGTAGAKAGDAGTPGTLSLMATSLVSVASNFDRTENSLSEMFLAFIGGGRATKDAPDLGDLVGGAPNPSPTYDDDLVHISYPGHPNGPNPWLDPKKP